MDIYANTRKIVTNLTLILIATTSVLLYLGHFQYETVLTNIVEEEQRIASDTNDFIFKSIYDKYRNYGEMFIESPSVIEAVATGERERLYWLSKPFYDKLRRENPYLKIMHFHTADNHSFLRVHKPETYGDDLSRLRPMIVQTNRLKEGLSGIEVGKYGIYYRITFPLFDVDGTYIGAFEFGIDIRYLMELLNKQGVFVPMLLMHRHDIAPIYEFAKEPERMFKLVNDNYALVRYDLSHHDWNTLTAPIDASILHQKYLIARNHGSDHLVFIAADLQNYLGDTVGHFIFAKELDFYTRIITVVRWVSIATAALLIVITMLLVRRLLAQYSAKFKDYEAELLRVNTKLQYVIEGSNLGYWDWYIQSHEHYVNERWMEMLGLTQKDMSGTDRDWSSRLHPEDRIHVMPIIEKAIENRTAYNVEFRMRHKDGHYVWIQGAGAVVEHDEHGKPLRISGTHQDISERKRLEEENEQNRYYHEALFRNNPNIVVVTDSKEMIDTNAQFFRFFDQYPDINAFKSEHSCICDLFEYSDDPLYLHPDKGNWIRQAMGENQKQAIIVKDGKRRYFSVTVNAFPYNGEELYLSTLTDITQEHRLQEKLEHLSVIDDLTGVFNRRQFNKLFDREIRRARREQSGFCFLMIDVDNFKNYNDNYGHDMGDKALTEIARALRHELKRPGDYLFRLGGEEFGVIFSDISRSKSVTYAEKLCREVEALKIPHDYNVPYGTITISIGVCHTDYEEGTPSVTEIYRRADEALYRAKNKGRNRVEQ